MHLMSFGDAFGFFAFMVMMLLMMGFVLIGRFKDNAKVKGAAKDVGGMAARAGKAWLVKKLKR